MLLLFYELWGLKESGGSEGEAKIANRLVLDHLALVEYIDFGCVEMVSFDIDEQVLPVVGHSVVAVFQRHHEQELDALEGLDVECCDELASFVDGQYVLVSEEEVDCQDMVVGRVLNLLLLDGSIRQCLLHCV